jgi:hypothetical protein
MRRNVGASVEFAQRPEIKFSKPEPDGGPISN